MGIFRMQYKEQHWLFILYFYFRIYLKTNRAPDLFINSPSLLVSKDLTKPKTSLKDNHPSDPGDRLNSEKKKRRHRAYIYLLVSLVIC